MILLQVDPALQAQIAFALTLISTLLGLLVGYIAIKGYLRSRKRPMFFIALGFFLVFWTPLLLLAGPVLAPLLGQFLYGMLGEISRILGLICILYGLRVPFSSTQ